jgi:hypothetical protein
MGMKIGCLIGMIACFAILGCVSTPESLGTHIILGSWSRTDISNGSEFIVYSGNSTYERELSGAAASNTFSLFDLFDVDDPDPSGTQLEEGKFYFSVRFIRLESKNTINVGTLPELLNLPLPNNTEVTVTNFEDFSYAVDGIQLYKNVFVRDGVSPPTLDNSTLSLEGTYTLSRYRIAFRALGAMYSLIDVTGELTIHPFQKLSMTLTNTTPVVDMQTFQVEEIQEQQWELVEHPYTLEDQTIILEDVTLPGFVNLGTNGTTGTASDELRLEIYSSFLASPFTQQYKKTSNG